VEHWSRVAVLDRSGEGLDRFDVADGETASVVSSGDLDL
jgi:hypothetical protein